MSSASLSRVFCCFSCQKVAGNQSETVELSAKHRAMEKIVRIEVVDSEEQVVHALIQFVEEKSKAAIAKRDRFVIGLSGKFHQMLYFWVNFWVCLESHQICDEYFPFKTIPIALCTIIESNRVNKPKHLQNPNQFQIVADKKKLSKYIWSDCVFSFYLRWLCLYIFLQRPAFDHIGLVQMEIHFLRRTRCAFRRYGMHFQRVQKLPFL